MFGYPCGWNATRSATCLCFCRHLACEEERVEDAKLLIENGSSLHVKNKVRKQAGLACHSVNLNRGSVSETRSGMHVKNKVCVTIGRFSVSQREPQRVQKPGQAGLAHHSVNLNSGSVSETRSGRFSRSEREPQRGCIFVKHSFSLSPSFLTRGPVALSPISRSRRFRAMNRCHRRMHSAVIITSQTPSLHDGSDALVGLQSHLAAFV